MLARSLVPIVVSGSLFVGLGCVTRGSGNRIEEARTIEAFDALESSGSLHVFLRAGEPPSARVVADDNLVPLIETSNVGDALHVRTTGSYMTSGALEVHVSTPAVKSIDVSGSGNVDARGIETDALELELSGSGRLTIEGRAKTVTIALSGSGNLDATALQAEDVTIAVSGSGSAKLTATASLHATVSGSGTVRYGGKPSDVQQNVSGSGSVRPL